MGYRATSRRHAVSPAMLATMRDIAGSPFHIDRADRYRAGTLDALSSRHLAVRGTLRRDNILHGLFKDRLVVHLTPAGWAYLHLADSRSTP